MKRAVFLDRDGTLLDGWGSIFPGTRTQLLRLKDAGFLLIVVTNQPDIGAGKMKREVVDRTHENLAKVLPVDEIIVCPHEAKEKCGCRKPEPGMLLEGARTHESPWRVDLSRSFMIGDRWQDVGAGEQAGCTTILIGTGYGESFKGRVAYNRRADLEPDHRAADLSHAVDIILESA